MSAAAAKHAIFEQHALDFDNVEVIDCERHMLKRRAKEVLHINAEKPSIKKAKRQRIGIEPILVLHLLLTPFLGFRKALRSWPVYM